MRADGYSAAEPVTRLVEEFHKLPGIGPKTAQRLTYYLIRMPEEQARSLAEAVLAVKERITLCSHCFNITESDPCCRARCAATAGPATVRGSASSRRPWTWLRWTAPACTAGSTTCSTG